jgi:ubiquinone/menaquinone biosynthesis C-methylase UbiE
VTFFRDTSAKKVYEILGATDLAAQGVRPGGLKLTQRALDLAGLEPGSRFVDVGCGAGVTLEFIRSRCAYLAVGVDHSSAMLRFGNAQHSGLEFVQAQGESLPFGNGYADGLMAECVLSLMNYSDKALNEFCRVLKPRGKLLLTDVYARNDDGMDRLDKLPFDCCMNGAIPKQGIIKIIERYGFQIELWEDHSELLKEFAVQLIFSYGSLNDFWGQVALDRGDRSEIQKAISILKPGYYLLIATKTIPR